MSDGPRDIIERGKAAEMAVKSYLEAKLQEIEQQIFYEWTVTFDPQALYNLKFKQAGVDAVKAAIQADIDAYYMAKKGQ
jgi:hypothetical protein